MTRAALGALAAFVLGLALSVAPVHGARSAAVAPAAGLPPDAAAAVPMLRRALRRAPDAQTAADIRYVLRLADRYLDPRARVPSGRRATVAKAVAVNAWWFSRRGAPADRALIRDPDGVILTYLERHGFMVNPVATTGRWQGLNRGFSAEQLAGALVDLGVRRRAAGRAMSAFEYFDVPGDDAAIRPGLSGMAQGRVALLFARVYYRTGRHRFADAAAGALAAFQVPVARGGVVSRLGPGGGPGRSPWYVERAYPGASPWRGAALNGFMVTLLNLDQTAALLRARPTRTPPPDRPTALRPPPPPPASGPPPRAPGAEAAARLAQRLTLRGTASLRRFLPLHDTGDWSLYGLRTPGYTWRTHLADRNYHCYHVRLLRTLARHFPKRGFAATAARWNAYAGARGASCD